MRNKLPILMASIFLAASAPVLALSESGSDDVESNRRLLESNRRLFDKWRNDPEHYTRLKNDYHSFQKLSVERQDRIRQFDRDLNEETSDMQARLWRSLDRYVTWLERLPEERRRQIEEATDQDQRLILIKQLREREWIDRLPRPTREKVLNTGEDKRSELIADLRQKDRERRLDLERALQGRDEPMPRRAQPRRLLDFPWDVQVFVKESLLPRLSADERARLNDAQGQWPLYGQTLVELADKHPPVYPPALAVPWPTHYKNLPAEIQQQLQQHFKQKELNEARKAEGKWPEYPLAVLKLAEKKKVELPNTQGLGPNKPGDFSASVKGFIKDKLVPKLEQSDPADLKRLHDAERQWPRYPSTLLELAAKHNLTVPGMILPGSKAFWDNLRTALPEVPDNILRDFALTELSPDELANLHLSLNDPSIRERLTEKFFERHPNEKQRLLQSNNLKHLRKAKKTPEKPELGMP